MNNPILLLSALLLGMGMFNIDTTKTIIGKIKHWLLNEDREHLFAYGMTSLGIVVVVVLIVNSWY